MRGLIFSILILISCQAFASGKITLQNNFFNEGKVYRPMVGLQVYQRLSDKVAINTWAGYGIQPLEIKDDVKWLVAKAQLDFQIKKVTLAAGLQYKHLVGEGITDHIPFIKLDYQLWK